MSFAETVLLGALAGFTIFLGLPIGRLQILGARGRVALAMFAVGVLSFIFVDVLSHGFAIVENAVTKYHDHQASFGHAALGREKLEPPDREAQVDREAG